MSAFLLAEGGRIIRAERREDLRARAGLTEESLSALEAVCGKTAGDAGYEEAVGLAAALFAAGFTAEEAQRFFSGVGRRQLLEERRWEIVKTIHNWRQRLGQVDYLLEQELRSLDVK